MPAEPTNQSVGASSSGGWLAAIAHFAVRRPKAVLVGWLALTITAGVLSGGLNSRLSQGGFDVPGSQSLRVQEDLQTRFSGQSAAATVLVIRADSEVATGDGYQRVVAGLAAQARGIADVSSVITAAEGGPDFVSKDGRTSYVVVSTAGDLARQQEIARELAAIGADVGPGYEVTTAGNAAFFDRLNEVSREDLEKAERVTFPITLIILVVAFGSIVAAGLPILLAIVSLIVTLGALFLLAGAMDMNVFVTNSASVVGIGVGIDYALFVVTRFREERKRGRDTRAAVVRSIETAGRAVLLSGLTVVVALAGMFLVDISAFRSMAVGMMVVVVVAVAAALTALPALLAMLGERVESLHVPRLGRSRQSRVDGNGFWHRWALAVMRRPWLALVGSVAVLLLLAAPFASLRLGQPSPRVLPADEGPRISSERLAESFGPGVSGPMEILVEAPGGATSAANLARIGALTAALAADPGVASVRSLTAPVVVPAGTTDPATLGALAPAVAGLVNWDKGADLTRVTVVPADSPSSDQANNLLQRIRSTYFEQAGLAGFAYVGGETASNVDLADEISSRMPWVVGLVLILSFLLLAMAFRSLLLPLKALVMNLLSVAASYGMIVAVFQWGWGEDLLGFTSEGTIAAFVPLFLFSILFGLSMDYEVFLLSRMREDYLRTGSNELAVAQGLEATARTITSAALIMVTVFAAFASSRVLPFKQMGFGLAVAVFLDAAVVRTVLVPAAMKLMGDWNWWMPGWLDRALPTIRLEAHDDEAIAREPVAVG